MVSLLAVESLLWVESRHSASVLTEHNAGEIGIALLGCGGLLIEYAERPGERVEERLVTANIGNIRE